MYYQPVIDTFSLELMHQIDEEYTKAWLYGSRKIAAVLKKKGIWSQQKESVKTNEIDGDWGHLSGS